MIKKIIENKYSNAFLLLMLYSAMFHIAVLAVRCFLEKSIYPLNFFAILNLDILFPDLFKNTLAGNAVALIVVVLIYLILLKTRKISI